METLDIYGADPHVAPPPAMASSTSKPTPVPALASASSLMHHPQMDPLANGGVSTGSSTPSGPSARPATLASHLNEPSSLPAASSSSLVRKISSGRVFASPRATNAPPYPPPKDVDILYPTNAKPNPSAGSMDPQPAFGSDHPPGSLYRPDLMPPDLDERLDKRSIWMVLEERTNKATYLSPPPCDVCRSPNIAQHCDRGYPTCGRCRYKGLPCEFRDAQWTIVRPRPKKKRKPSNVDPTAVDDEFEPESTSASRPRIGGRKIPDFKGAQQRLMALPLLADEHREVRHYNDAALAARCIVNLADSQARPPVWSRSWMAYADADPLFTDLELLTTDGGQVGKGKDGTAAGVVLRGTHYGQGPFCSDQGPNGTIVASLGLRRARNTLSSDSVEEPAVRALLAAHRARTPVAIVIARDYAGCNVSKPRPFALWGYFWVTASWRLEPDVPGLQFYVTDQKKQNHFPAELRWKFRFEYCPSQGIPWWHAAGPEPSGSVQQVPLPNGEANAWHVRGPTINGSPTVRPASADQQVDARYTYACPHCNTLSDRVYAQGNLCLNEACRWYFGEKSGIRGDGYIGPCSIQPGPLAPLRRLLPEEARSRLLPIVPPKLDYHRRREDLGKSHWSGWVCQTCNMANESTRWKSTPCLNCQAPYDPAEGSQDISLAQLRDPHQPIATMARTDDGFPSMPDPAYRSSRTYEDQIRVVDYGVKRTENDAQMLLAMHVEVQSAATGGSLARLFADLMDGGSEGAPLHFVRYLKPSSMSDEERRRMPYFSHSWGVDSLSGACRVPAKSDKVDEGELTHSPVLSALSDHITERCDRFWPGGLRLDSFMLLAVPPELSFANTLKYTVQPNSHAAIFWLGSGGSLKIRPTEPSKAAELHAVQSGDIFGIHTGDAEVDLIPSTQVFGFICIAQRLNEALRQLRAGNSKPTVKVDKPELAPLTDWYIGSRPLDTAQPLRPAPPMRIKPVRSTPNGAATASESTTLPDAPEGEAGQSEEKEWSGVEPLEMVPDSPKELAPPPYTMPELSDELKAKRNAVATGRKGIVKVTKEAKETQAGKEVKGKKRKSAAASNTPDTATLADDRSSVAVKLEEGSSVASGPLGATKKARQSDASLAGSSKKKARKSGAGA